MLRAILWLRSTKRETMPCQGLPKLVTRVPDVVLLEGGSCALGARRLEKLAPGAAPVERRDALLERIEKRVLDVSDHRTVRKYPTVNGPTYRAAQAPSVQHRTMDPFA